ncbi:alpha-xylosidase [Halosolutus halophilus]|uniref:alpha-xylosidase n=1 Tax=Halosolutus halophilus TaxID=1552990 RepID=UPI002234F871|nr:alpha-xylosidase [Halosolutus halophilus]
MVNTTVSSVREYERTGNTIELLCDVDRTLEQPRSDDRPVPVTIRFLNASTFRFELRANPEAGTDRNPYPEFDEDAIREDVVLDLDERDGVLAVDTGDLCLEIGLETWSFRVEDADGAVRFEEQRKDLDVRGNDRVEPLGFREEEINHGPHRVTETGTAFALAPGERIYGLGEKFTPFDRRGQEIESWHVEPLGTESERAYKNIPFHVSSRGYGLLVDTTHRVRYDLGNESTASATVAVEDDTFAFVFFAGSSIKEIHSAYTALTGRPDRPPKWSFGVWMSRLGYESREQLEAITARLREEEIPADVVHLDPFWMRENKSTDLVWDTEQFPDPEGMIEELHENGFRLSLWEHPHVPVSTEAFETGREEGYFVEDGTGKPYVMERTCQGDYRGAIVDFTNPDAVAWWTDKHRDLLEMGVDTFKTDYGEYIPEDAVFDNGLSGKAMHNLYPYLYNEAVYETVGEVNGDDQALVWGRAGWTGSQRFPVHWGGDPQTSFNGMAAALRGGLSASLSGIGYWSHDIGGFRGEPDDEVYVRWAQFGLLSSHSRCHGTTPREPWAFGERAVEIFREFARLRYRLLPYIYSEAEVTSRTGYPIVRPLLFEFEDDPRTHEIADQYLLGESLLVAPVFDETDSRSVYLPEGEWIEWWSGERYAGEQTLDVDVPLDRIPLYVRAGCVLPTREPAQTVQEGPPERLTLQATLADGGASGRYYDEARDELAEIEVGVDGTTLIVDVGQMTPVREFVVEGVDGRVEGVSVNGTPLSSVETAPSPGEWVDEGENVRFVVE